MEPPPWGPATTSTRTNTTRTLTGYRLENLVGETYPLPTGFVIRDGQPVRIHSGHGVDGTAVLFWGRNSGAWDNFTECVQLVSPSGGRYRVAINGGCTADADSPALDGDRW